MKLFVVSFTNIPYESYNETYDEDNPSYVFFSPEETYKFTKTLEEGSFKIMLYEVTNAKEVSFEANVIVKELSA